MNEKKSGKKRGGYPISLFLIENLKEKTTLKELIRLYSTTNEYKPTDRAFQKAANQLAAGELIKLERKEQLWLIPIQLNASIPEENRTKNEPKSMLGRKIDKRIHSTHKIKLSIKYKGEQPKLGGIEKVFGRYRTARQYIFHKDIHTIGAYKNCLVIWVRNPDGILTIEQRINAQAEGYKTLKEFSKEHNIKLEGYLEKVELSHHVVENDSLNNALKPMVQNYPQINEKLGTHVCQTSHPGRIEHEGRAREDRIVRGDQVATGLEKLVLDFPSQFEQMVKMNYEFSQNLALHIGVLRKIEARIDEMNQIDKKRAQEPKHEEKTQ